MKIIVTGASGMVGGEVVREAIKDKEIEQITAIVRKPLDIQSSKLITILHSNFLDYSNLTEVFKQHDSLIWCLGIAQALVTKEEYNVITYDYTIAAAKALLASNPDATFLFLSGAGADQTEKSRVLFSRIKGKAENELLRMGWKKLFIARPAGIKPVRKNAKAPFAYKIFYSLYPIIKLLMPNFVITSQELATALLRIAKNGSEEIILNNKDLKNIAFWAQYD